MIVPKLKPQIKRIEAEKLLPASSLYPVQILGLRGYYKDTMGVTGKNDRGIYDDAILIISPTHYSSWNANTDPSVLRKGIAVLKEGGPYLYKIGRHGVSGPNPYLALRQFGRVTVIRDGEGEFTDTAEAPFYIDIHRGGYTTTSSLGCQTIHPYQWNAFFKSITSEMEKYKQAIVPYYVQSMK